MLRIGGFLFQTALRTWSGLRIEPHFGAVNEQVYPLKSAPKLTVVQLKLKNEKSCCA